MGPGDVKVEDTTGEGSGIKKSVLEKSSKMTTILEPPSFVSEKKSFGVYKKRSPEMVKADKSRQEGSG